MKVILINGSPREKGCTYRALSEVASALEANGIETEIIHATFDRAVISETAKKVEEAEGLVVGSPVYYASASGLCTFFMDELFNRVGGKVRLKVAASLCSCRRGGASATFDQLNKYFTISQMIVVSANYWNQVHGNKPEEVEEDVEGLQTLRILGNNMAYVIKSLKAAGLGLPEMEKVVKTNFIR